MNDRLIYMFGLRVHSLTLLFQLFLNLNYSVVTICGSEWFSCSFAQFRVAIQRMKEPM